MFDQVGPSVEPGPAPHAAADTTAESVVAAAAVDRAVEQLDDLRRRMVLLGDQLADSHRALDWDGLAHERFARHLRRRLAQVSLLATDLAAAIHELDHPMDQP